MERKEQAGQRLCDGSASDGREFGGTRCKLDTEVVQRLPRAAPPPDSTFLTDLEGLDPVSTVPSVSLTPQILKKKKKVPEI